MKYYYQIEGDLRNNIGDVLQGMVAKAFLPKGALVVDREALGNMAPTNSLLIANGWYMHSFDKFPPPANVIPVYLSVHIARSQLLTNKNVREHFKKHSPIGCRDKKTLKLFLGWGIPAYYSSCLTTTTSKRTENIYTGNGEVLLVDNIDHPIPDEIKSKLEKLLGTSLVRISHDPPIIEGTIDEYFQISEKYMNTLLERYCKASLVVTTKIHCALPCLGMGAKVMLVHPNPSDPRLATVREFMDIISYNDILTAKEISVPKVNQQALNKRKEFLSNVVASSVSSGHNIVRFPNNLELKRIKFKSILLSKFYRIAIKTIFGLGLATQQMKKIYTTN